MHIRFHDFEIERTSPKKVTLKQHLAGDGRARVKAVGSYSGYGGAISEMLFKLAEEGRDFRDVERHWQAFSEHVGNLHRMLQEMEDMEVA